MAIVIDTIEVTTDASGDATAYSGRTFNGKLVAIDYAKDDFANGVDFTITSEETGQTLWTQSDVNAGATKYPLTQACSTAGVAATLDGTRALLVPIALCNERIKAVIAQGGDTKTGAFSFVVDGY
jgi:hypothetical protein